MRECETCVGTGFQHMECEECNRDGWVSDDKDGGTMTCPSCDGESSVTCSGCDGEGYFEEPTAKENQ